MEDSFRIKLRDDIETAEFSGRGGARGERAFARIFILDVAEDDQPDIAARMATFAPGVIAQIRDAVNGDQLVVDGTFDAESQYGPSLVVSAVSRIDRYEACPIECGGVFQRQAR